MEIDVVASGSIVSYGPSMVNNVYVTSDQRTVQSEGNPAKASFKNSEGTWAQLLDNVVGTSLDEERLDVLKTILGEDLAGNGYISSNASVSWNTASNLTLIKSVYGDRDTNQSYSSTNVATVSNGGTAYYRLTVSSSNNTEGSVNLSLVDKKAITLMDPARETVNGRFT